MTLSDRKSELDLLKEELFGNPETAISDIKFYPLENSTTTIEELAATIRAAIASVKAGGGEEVDLSI